MSDKEIGQDGKGDGDCGKDEEIVAERDQYLEEKDESFTSSTHSINPLLHLDLSNSSNSNWQNSGLTRSEVEFSRKKQGSRNQGSICSSSSSSIILKIKSNENSEDEYPYPVVNSTPRSKDEDCARTSNGNGQPKELSAKPSSQNFVSTSTTSTSPTVWLKIHPNKKGHRVKAKSKGIQTGDSISETIIRDRLNEKIEKHRDKNQVDFDTSSNKEKRQRDKRHENHRHHDLSNILRKPFKSLTNTNNENTNSASASSKSKSNINFESKSELTLSPTCRIVTEALRLDPSSSQKRKNELLKAVDLHREIHINKVRTEIQKLEILNKLLLSGKIAKSANSNSSSTTNSENESDADADNTDSSTHSNIRNRYYDSRPDDKVDDKLKHRNFNFTSIQNKNKSKSNSSLSASKEKRKVMTSRIHSTSDGKIDKDKDLTFEEKLDKLLSAFDKLSGNRSLIENSDSSSESEEENYAKTLKQKLGGKYKNYKKEKESVSYKPSISYYVPIKKPLDSNEIDETDDEVKKEKEIPNIQEAFEMGNQSFLNRAKEREKIISDVKEERKRREEIKRNWACANIMYSNGGFENENNDYPTNLNLTPRGPSIMSVKEMKELTEKNYRKLPEVQEKIHQQIMDQEKRTNRFMSQLFANNLRRSVLKGQMNVEHYRSLIRN